MKTTSFTILIISLVFCLSNPLLSQEETFTVILPKLEYPPDEEGQGWIRPRVWGELTNEAEDDTIFVPSGRPIYALFVSGYGRNGNFDELHFYKFARVLMEHGAYVHYAWWNNLLAPYMERPLHYKQSYPGDLSTDYWEFMNYNEGQYKGLPGEDYQFVEDAKIFLSAIRENNPNAIIIIVGHSMGGGAIVHLASPWNTDERIDILAPIDPVGNRNYPWAGSKLLRDGERDYNWTRWRVTRDKFLGYKRMEKVGQNCYAVGDWLQDYRDAKEGSSFGCSPYPDPALNRLRFGTNVIHLYHRWQNEFFFPYDYKDDYVFLHTPPPGFTVQDEQAPITFRSDGSDLGGWPKFTNAEDYACCPDEGGVGWKEDGHGEIVGYRGPVDQRVPKGRRPVPLGVRVRTSLNCGTQCLGKYWPWRYKEGNNWKNDSSASRVKILKELENLPTDSTWEHCPTNPDLCLVSDGLIILFNRISSQWTQQLSGTSRKLRSVFFTDTNNGWVVGDNGLIKHTTDGGTTWLLQPSGTNKRLTDVHFTDANTGWAVGYGGVIINTADGGNTWTDLKSSGTSKNITAVYFTDANTGWAVGDDGLIKHTTDNGKTWPLQYPGTSRDLTDVHFTDANTGWAVGYGGVIINTADGGNTWTDLKSSGTSKNITAVYFTDASTGWIVGFDGLIKHTTDGGNNWTLQLPGTSRDLTDVHFTDANTGWVVGYGGLITHTTDGGNTWNLQVTGRLNNLESVYFTGANTGWVVGGEGLILNTNKGTVISIEEKKIYEMPTDFHLFQNYPNPFNPTTTIRFSLPEAAFVKLTIFDRAGRHIRELFNGPRTAGSHALIWDGKNDNGIDVSSGIYFLKMNSGEYSFIRKMMLLR